MYVSNKAVGDHLRVARNRKKLTQAKVAEELGISEKHYGHIERGTRIASLEMLGHLCSLYEVPLEDLIAGILVTSPQFMQDRTRDTQIKHIMSMLNGMTDNGIDMIASMIQTVSKYEIR